MPVLSAESADAPPGAKRSTAEIRAWFVDELARTLKLGTDQIDTARPMQELGADSLTAFTLTGALADWLEREIPVSLFWDYGSIDAVAKALAAEATEPTLPAGVVALQPHGKRRPLFCFPGIGGHPVTFARLAQHLAPDVPCYGLATPGFNGEQEPPRSVEQIVQALLEAVRVLQPHGPYQFAGFSFGGLLAYEAAQQLRARGETVSLLAIYDTFTPDGLVLRPAWQRLALHLWDAATRDGRIDRLRSHLQARRQTRTRPALLDRLAGDDVDGRIRVVAAAEAANREASLRYSPRPYSGQLLLFRAAQRSPDMRFFMFDAVSNGWQALAAGGTKIIPIDARHDTILDPKNVAVAADLLRPHLR